jgi:hypothetical protein
MNRRLFTVVLSVFVLTASVFFSSCEDDPEPEVRPEFASTADITAAGGDKVSIRVRNIRAYDGYVVKINGVEPDQSMSYSGAEMDFNVTVPHLCGDGRIELVHEEKQITIQGPMFHYKKRYLYFFTNNVLGWGMTGLSNGQFITWDALSNTFHRLKANGFISEDYGGELTSYYFTLKHEEVPPVTIPNENKGVMTLGSIFAMTATSDGDIIFAQEYDGPTDYYTNLLITDFENTLTIAPDPAPYSWLTDIEVNPTGGWETIYASEEATPYRITKSVGGVVSLHAGSATTAGHTDAVGAAARFDHIYATAIGPNEELYVADQHSVRKVTKDGTVTTIAGSTSSGDKDGTALEARFNTIVGIHRTSDGTLYVADSGNKKVKTISPDGKVETLIGPSFNTNKTVQMYVDEAADIIYMMVGREGRENLILAFVADHAMSKEAFEDNLVQPTGAIELVD